MVNSTKYVMQNLVKKQATKQSIAQPIRRNFSTQFNRQFETNFGAIHLKRVENEPKWSYAKGSKEREKLLNETKQYENVSENNIPEIPCIINGERYYSNDIYTRETPSNIKQPLFKLHSATSDMVEKAVQGSLEAKKEWENMSLEHKCSVFMRAAELLSSEKWRYTLNAAAMMGQGKTMWEAEIETACETADFWRFNAAYMSRLVHSKQMEHHDQRVWNHTELRPLEGFVAAISPFNFTAIGANLPSAPAQAGNVSVWKPSHTALLSNYYIYLLLEEAGLPPGVIQFVPTHRHENFSDVTFNNPNLGAFHFTGSLPTFTKLYKQIIQNLENYKSFPRIVGETGGKNFHLALPDCDVEDFVHHTIRAAFDFSGQKCSAASRCYVPKSLWPEIKELLVNEVQNNVKVGQPNDPSSFLSSVIDEAAFDKISGFVDRAKQDSNCEIIAGGTYSKEVGYFIDPTVIHTKDPNVETMREEIFGPVTTIYVYDDSYQGYLDNVLSLIDNTSRYGLTGAIFGKRRDLLDKCTSALRHSAGNFYINDKCTGSIVGQQPFGGARKSGTNFKAGSETLIECFLSHRSIKETYVPIDHFKYPSVD